jgi:hypothetical protein
MKPIDTIRKGIDSDLLKYHHGTMCKIIEIDDLGPAGIVASVVPLSEYEEIEQKDAKGNPIIGRNEQRSYDSGSGKKYMERYNVIILNRPIGQIETDVKEKHHVLLLNTVQDRSSYSPAFLIPKSTIDLTKKWPEAELKKIKPKARTLVARPT